MNNKKKRKLSNNSNDGQDIKKTTRSFELGTVFSKSLRSRCFQRFPKTWRLHFDIANIYGKNRKENGRIMHCDNKYKRMSD